MNPNPYHRYVAEIARLAAEGKTLPTGGVPPARHPTLLAELPSVLLFSPHPDDECIVGALPLRLQREARLRVIDVAVTLGSNKERQAARLGELRGACDYLGFELITTGPHGLERISPGTRAHEAAHWEAAIAVIAEILDRERPAAVFMPHDDDANSTHIGTHLLVRDALARQERGFVCHLVETEFWRAMAAPNLMVESSVDDVAALVAATAFHAGEVARNPYHLSLPAWMQDNVRRGGELVGVQGGAVPDFTFATLYRVLRFEDGQLAPAWQGGRQIARRADVASIFAG
jgi:LmbE family N-acetylglucosaminyl deacetylase